MITAKTAHAGHSTHLLASLFTSLLWVYAGLAHAQEVEVLVEGIKGELKINTLEFLSIEQQKNQAGLNETRIRSLHRQAPQEIRAALQPFGYYRPKIETQLETTKKRWLARYRVDPGPALPMSVVDIQILGAGQSDQAFQDLLTNQGLDVGETVNHPIYEALKQELQKLAARRGYFDARWIKSEIQIDLNNYTGYVLLHYDTGPRYHFGAVTFDGHAGLSTGFLTRFVSFKPGDPYTTDALLKLQSGLSDSDYFQSVEVEPQRDSAHNLEIPILVKLVTRKPDKYSLGVGYGTDTGARAKAAWERRLINDFGQRFASELNVSEITTDISARYVIPVGDPRTDQVTLSTGWTHEHPETSDSRTRSLGVSYSHSRGVWRETWAINYRNEKFQAADDRGRTTSLMPSLGWSHTKADDRVHTHRGYRLSLDLRGASESLGSDVSFFQARARGKYIYPLSDNGRFIARIDAGATRVRDFDNLGASLRYYAGGDQSVRGYAYNSLGPINSAGEVTGGRKLLVGSLEYEYRLERKWSIATFYDVGNAFNEDTELFKKGAGVGVHWRSPIGPIRLDVASALSEVDKPWRIHLIIGPDL